eukprot:CAMPEP_0197537708 /NCGR_PEP_ID=MMETSP1318-20131121/57703_1 /TAXON_ID=552666 /ORGANISM="Partenskyella glossopodia, Strain RCC365" /LENGTH=44 /DNA_ID= /DNA_START= /DNA_END= /DNA_ORIENTATION=
MDDSESLLLMAAEMFTNLSVEQIQNEVNSIALLKLGQQRAMEEL